MGQRGEADLLARWKDNVANGSQVYADVSSRRLRAFCEDSQLSATELVALEPSDLRRTLEDYLAREKRRGHSGEYIRTTLKAIRSWRLYNGKPYVEGLKVPNATLSPRVESETVPTQQDLHRVLLAAKPNERVAISLMAFSGLRPQAIGSYDGTDGLTVGDLPELRIEGKRVRFEKTPTLVRVRAKNSKAKHGYLSFLASEGCLAVQQYLEQRLIAGERIDASTDLVHPERSAKKFIRALNVGDGVRRAMRAAGLDQRPYVWRTYFLSRLLEASNAGKVSDRYVEFWAGHTGDVTSRHYTTGRANLAASMIEDMRKAYARAESYLSTASTSGDERRRLVQEELLRTVGCSEEEIRKYTSDEKADIPKIIRDKLGASAPQVQRIVSVDDARPLLTEGWKVVTSAGPGVLVLNPPI